MREIFDKIFKPLANAVGIHSKFEWWVKLLFWVVLIWPQKGLVWIHGDLLEPIFAAVHLPMAALVGTLWVLSIGILTFMFTKGLELYLPLQGKAVVPVTTVGADGKIVKTGQTKEIKTEVISPFEHKPKKITFKKDDTPFVQIGDMIFTEKDLYTSVLVTGVTGTGKTSAAIYPMLEQLFSIYSEEGAGDYGKIGGLLLDVKGEFFEHVIYYMHNAGRNIFEDIQVIRPNCYMPVVRFKDPQTGHLYYLNAKSCATGAEAWDMIRGQKFKDGTDIPLTIFTFPRRKLEVYEPKLKELTFDMSGKKPNYLGWRWQGERMVRVTHTPAFNETHCLLKNGQKIVTEAPKQLVYDSVIFVDNQLRYNIVEPHKPAAEAAMRLNLISTLAEGEKQTGENAYWYKRARSHIGSCIDLWRLAYDETPQCTAQAIYKMTQQDDYCRKQVKLVEAKIKSMQDELTKITEFADRVSIEREIERTTSIVKYFTEEWGKYDSKTKTIVGSVVANAFDTFNKDPILQDSFCQPKTFSFEESINDGKLYVLAAGDEYETVAKILGTALKMDFQSVVLSRMHRSELNQKRKIMLVNDECQKFVVAGGSQGAGDEHFMSLCRQSKCMNINATQADSWIISVVGKENSDVYLQNYNGRIWFRTNDKDTAEKAEQLCGIKKQKTRSAGSEKVIHLENLLMGPKGSADHSPSFSEKEEEKPRMAKDKFYNLETWECILFNGSRTGSDKVCQTQCEPAFSGSPDGLKEVAAIMKIYFQGYLENLAFKQNGGRLFDPQPEVNVTPAKALEAALPVGTEGAAAGRPTMSSSVTQVPIPVAGQSHVTATPIAPAPLSVAPAMPNPALSPAAQLGPAPALTSFGEAEALKARAAKLLKSVVITAPRVCNPTDATMAPFAKTTAPTAPTAPQSLTVSAPVAVAQTATAPAQPAAVDTAKAEAPQLPRVDANFKPTDVTPHQLQTAQHNYQTRPTENLQEVLKDANFIDPINPTEYLPAKREEELLKAGDPGLAAERAALGPNGRQGGNPAFAMAQGQAVNIPTQATDTYERNREEAIKEEQKLNSKSFVAAIGGQEGPKPDTVTMDLLKNLKPETDDTKK